MSHIAYVIPTLDRIGGAEGQVLVLAKGMVNRNWRVTVIALSGNGGDAARELSSVGVAFHSLRMRKGLADPRGWVGFHRWVEKEAPDVVHAHLPHATWLARWSRLFASIPVLVDSIHTSATGTIGRRLGYRWSDWLPDRVAAVSQSAADAHLSARMVSAGKLMSVPNGIDVARWHPDREVRIEWRKRRGIENGEFLWVAAGRLDPVKDYPSVLRAMTDVPQRALLVIAGAGREESRLRCLSARLGLEARVRFLGFEPNLLPWMQAADGFVLCSRWEGLPMSLLEAGAGGLPVVATDVAGSRDIVVDGWTGFLAAPGDSVALSSAMTRMMNLGPEERAVLGKQARLHIMERFRLESVLNRWEALYWELLDSYPRFTCLRNEREAAR